MVPRTWVLLRDATNILLEGVPTGMTVAEIRRAILESPGAAGVHDLHVWVSGADQHSCSAHVEIKLDADHEGARAQIVARLKDAFGLAHITLQLEREACADRERLHA